MNIITNTENTNFDDLWQQALNKSLVGLELKTKRGMYFHLTSVESYLLVNDSLKTPSIKIKYARKISKNEFLNVSVYYFDWINGKKGVRQKAGNISHNTSYIFSVFSYLIKSI